MVPVVPVFFYGVVLFFAFTAWFLFLLNGRFGNNSSFNAIFFSRGAAINRTDVFHGKYIVAEAILQHAFFAGRLRVFSIARINREFAYQIALLNIKVIAATVHTF